MLEGKPVPQSGGIIRTNNPAFDLFFAPELFVLNAINQAVNGRWVLFEDSILVLWYPISFILIPDIYSFINTKSCYKDKSPKLYEKLEYT